MIDRIFVFFGVAFVAYLYDRLLFRLFELFYCRRCDYDCSMCRAWSCMSKHCSRMRKKKEGGVSSDV